jgi:hypothetical protein
MADINVNFIHPTDGRLLTVTIDDSITTEEAVAELIGANFINPDPQGWELHIKGGNEILPEQKFRDAGVQNKTPIRVVLASDGGQK